MKSKFLKLIRKPFVRNVAIVASGTAAAQAINMAFAPVITRLYGPEAYGVLGVFLAVMAIISPIAALTYPTAIVLPKCNNDAKALIRLSMYISGVLSVIVAILLAFFNQTIVSILQIETIAAFLYLIPFVILFSALLQVVKQWMIRTKQFRITAKVDFLQAIFLNSAKVGFGFFNPIATVLVIIATLGSALQALMLFIGAKRSGYEENKEISESKSLKEIAVKYRDFPVFRAPQVFMNAASSSLPVLLLTSFFGPASAGFYTLGRTVLGIPTKLIGKSVGDVFYPRITEAANNNENLRTLILKATLLLAAIGLIPFGTIIAFGPWIFSLVFGAEWIVAGEYARWLSLWLFFMFFNRPSVIAIPVLKLQGSFLVYEIFSILSKIVALLVGFYYFKNDVLSVALFSITGAVAYAFLIIWIINSSKSFKS